MGKYQSPVSDLPDEHMRMIGIISTHWEWIELILERAVAESMLHKYERVATLTVNIGFHTKCDIIQAYAAHFKTTDPDQWSKFTKTLKQLKDSYTSRNKFIHAKWKMVGQTILRTEVRTKGGRFSIVEEPTKIDEMNAAAQEIADAGEALINLLQPFGVLLPSNGKSA